MKYNLRVLLQGGLAAAFLCAPQSVFADTTCNGGGTCFEVGPVFPTSQSGARRNYALALVEELLEEGVDETGGGSGDRKPVDFYATIFHRNKDYETQNTVGMDSDTTGGIIGVTLRDSQFLIGASIDYSREDATFKEGAGEQDTDELGLNLYGTYFPLVNNNLFVSGVFRYANRDIDTRRNVQGEVTDGTFDSGTAQGSTNGNDFSLLGGAGYSWQVQERTTFVLSGWLAWSEHDTDGYTESGSGAVPSCLDAGTQVKVSDAVFKKEKVSDAVFETRKISDFVPAIECPENTGSEFFQSNSANSEFMDSDSTGSECVPTDAKPAVFERVKVSDAEYETVKVSDDVYRTLSEPECSVDVDLDVDDLPTGDLRFEGDDYSTLDGILTATLLHSIPITNGRVIPSLSLSYVHEFQDDTRTINARMDDRPGQTVSVRTNEADTDYLRITASIGVEFNQGTTIFASYTGMAAHDWRNENRFNIGVKVLF